MNNKVDLKRWQVHLDAIERQGITVAQYAREQGISRHTLYAARAMQRAGAEQKATNKQTMAQPGQPAQTSTANGFTEVKLIAGAGMPPQRTATLQRSVTAATLRAWLANGVEMYLPSLQIYFVVHPLLLASFRST